MKIRLSNGELLDLKPSTPSKGQVKRSKGSLKRGNSRKALSACGGFANEVVAIAQPSDAPLCYVRSTTPSDARLSKKNQHLLKVRPAGGEYTIDLGGSCSTGYIGGRGV